MTVLPSQTRQNPTAVGAGHDLLSEYRRQGQELAELVHRLQHQLHRQDNLNERAQHYVDHISHEFRTPLAVINDYLAILQKGLAGSLNQEQQTIVSTISVHAAELNMMVEDILDVSRLDAGTVMLRRGDHCPVGVVERIKTMVISRAKLQNVEVEVDLQEDLPTVFCDPEKVGRALNNIAMNAIKFCGIPGKVSIQVEADEDRVRFAVADNGCGIPEAELEGIFQRFTQREPDKGSVMRGFGLGLSIAKHLIDVSYGSLQVESQLGLGSVFSFTVPTSDRECVVRAYVDYLRRSGQAVLRICRIVSRSASLGGYHQALCRCMGKFDLLLPIDDHECLALTVSGSADQLRERFFSIVQRRSTRTMKASPDCEFLSLGSFSLEQIESETISLVRAALMSEETRCPSPS